MKKSLLIICGIISCLLLATLASAKSPAAEERGVDLANYSSEDLSSNSAVVLHETPILANSSTPAVGSETSSGTDFSDYETDEAVKRKIADGVYEILDSDGTVIAIYQDTKREAQPRVGWAIDWTVDAGVNTGADSRFSSYDGLNFSYDIDFSRTGSSKSVMPAMINRGSPGLKNLQTDFLGDLHLPRMSVRFLWLSKTTPQTPSPTPASTTSAKLEI